VRSDSVAHEPVTQKFGHPRHDLYFWDLENAPPRKVVGFPTRDDLERFAYIRRNRKPLTQ
uniref:hypothetical protein n=1 Tax=Aquipseudomonas alcaligenes TaxID=43263 RepID=UPI00242BEF46